MPTNSSKRQTLTLFIVLAALFIFGNGIAQEETVSPFFNSGDRVLILAPHPDDECIGAGGAIQRALKAGAKVKIVLFTNGDNNELSFIVYEKRFTFKKGEFVHMGKVRRKETVKAMNFLGINQDDIISLGYPDFGTMDILTEYWNTDRPYRSMFARQTNVPYPESLSYGAPYVGESILKDLKRVLTDFKPTKIFVSHPADHNRDHQALYLFTRVALWDLEGEIERPELYPYLIHVIGWPKPKGYHPTMVLIPPYESSPDKALWEKFMLTDEEIKVKHDAICFYRSQIEYDPAYLFTFARKNELFGDYPIVSMKKQNSGKELEWQNLGIDPSLAYAVQNDNLFIKMPFKKRLNKHFEVSILLLGYSKKTNFADMPKIHLIVNDTGLHIKDKNQFLSIKEAHLVSEREKLIFEVPISILGNPDYVLTCTRTQDTDLIALNETSWRILSFL